MRVYVGYDEREAEAFHTCVRSIFENSDDPDLRCWPIVLEDLVRRNLYTRNEDPLASTKFTYSRFWVPYLEDYDGWAMFVDCDFIFTEDLRELESFCDDKYAVMCCKHNYIPSQDIKMDGRKQTNYPRKNWSSLMLFNCAKCKKLSLENLNKKPAKWLHRFMWVNNDLVGSLPLDWNFLVGEYKPIPGVLPRGIHYTNGGPWFKNYENVDYADIWNYYRGLEYGKKR